MRMNNNKSQSFSTDIIVVVVIILFGALFLIINKINSVEQGSSLEERYEDASLQAKLIVEQLKKEDVLDSQNEVNVEKLLVVNDQEMKEQLNLKNDFAIVFEKDGNLVKIDPDNDVNCVGSNKIIVNGENCK